MIETYAVVRSLIAAAIEGAIPDDWREVHFDHQADAVIADLNANGFSLVPTEALNELRHAGCSSSGAWHGGACEALAVVEAVGPTREDTKA